MAKPPLRLSVAMFNPHGDKEHSLQIQCHSILQRSWRAACPMLLGVPLAKGQKYRTEIFMSFHPLWSGRL